MKLSLEPGDMAEMMLKSIKVHLFLPAKEKGYVEEGGEIGEELEGEHLDGETLFCGSKRPCFL